MSILSERIGAVYTATLKDADEVPITKANLTAITLTLYNVADGTIINSRENQDVKDANNVTIHATTGLLTWNMQPEDNAIVSGALLERHRALWKYTHTQSGSPGKHEFDFFVRNLTKVP